MGNSTNTAYDINILRSKLNTFNANRHKINAICDEATKPLIAGRICELVDMGMSNSLWLNLKN